MVEVVRMRPNYLTYYPSRSSQIGYVVCTATSRTGFKTVARNSYSMILPLGIPTGFRALKVWFQINGQKDRHWIRQKQQFE